MQIGGSNQAARPLRILLGASLILAMAAAGALHRSAWIVVLAAPGFTALYVLGRWRPWLALWRRGAGKTLAGLALALPVQAMLAGLFYLFGLGAATVVGGPRSLEPLSIVDVCVGGLLFCTLTALAAGVVALERKEDAMDLSRLETASADDDLKIDPAPILPDTFFDGDDRSDAPREALGAQPGERVVKKPFAASEEMIVAAEARLSVRLPEGLRRLYGRRDGGRVGDLYVPLVSRPGQAADDWRGAFAIDYSSLRALHELCTVAQHYDGFTHDDEVPRHADRLVILEARYGDMTLLDYSGGDRDPQVLIVDFDRREGDPVDARFADFDAFFAALRRDLMWAPDAERPHGDLAEPLGDRDRADWPRLFWDANPHVLVNVARSRKDGAEPARKADSLLAAETGRRLGVVVPPALAAVFEAKNGGGVLAGYLVTVRGGRAEQSQAFASLAPMEFWTPLSELTARVDFPEGERPWTEGVEGAERLIVIEADQDEAVLLDYRGEGEPSLVLARGLAAAQGVKLSSLGAVSTALARLRPRL